MRKSVSFKSVSFIPPIVTRLQGPTPTHSSPGGRKVPRPFSRLRSPPPSPTRLFLCLVFFDRGKFLHHHCPTRSLYPRLPSPYFNPRMLIFSPICSLHRFCLNIFCVCQSIIYGMNATHIRMYARVDVYMRAYPHVCTHIGIYASTNTYMLTFPHTCTHRRIFCTHICTYACIYTYLLAYKHVFKQQHSAFMPTTTHKSTHICTRKRQICTPVLLYQSIYAYLHAFTHICRHLRIYVGT